MTRIAAFGELRIGGVEFRSVPVGNGLGHSGHRSLDDGIAYAVERQALVFRPRADPHKNESADACDRNGRTLISVAFAYS